MKIALVILNWNGKDLLQKFLPSIVSHSNIDEVDIYIADNASTDDSIDFVIEHFPTIKIVQNKTNGGYAKGYNDALQHIKADIYGLINSDIEVSENWLNSIVQIFHTENETAIVQPKILDFKNKTLFEYAGAGGGFIDELGYPYCRGRIFENLEKDLGQFNDEKEIFWASGACFFIRSKVFHSLKGFDENYFAHQEEIDLCWRAQNAGKKIRYTGKSTVFHVGGATLKEESPRKSFLNFRNSLFSLAKNLPTSKLVPILFIRLVLDGIAGLKFLIELRPVHTFAIIRAHFSFYYYFPKMLKKRKLSNQKPDYFTVKSIVWNYFILKNKKFDQL